MSSRAAIVTLGAAPLLLTALLAAGCSEPAGESPSAPVSSVITSTTRIAGAGVLGNQRRPDESCPAEPAAVDPAVLGESIRRVDSGTERGDIDVPADPQRIVVLSPDHLDVLCALGLQSRVVAATGQPSYLGTTIHDVPTVGTPSAPDPTGIAAAEPDLILGSREFTSQAYGEFAAIAPTVFTGAPGAQWRDVVRQVGAATGRGGAAGQLIDAFDEDAGQTGVANDASHFQASIVQLTENSVRVYGAQNFPASVMAAVGVDRPVGQRFTDKPYVEIAASDADLADADFSDADGDIVYVSFDSTAAKERAPAVLGGDAWRKLSAARDNRVFVVNNEVWQIGQGPVAARGILDDLRWINAPIN